MRVWPMVLVAAACSAASLAATAQTATAQTATAQTDPSAVQTPIKGTDVMGDKGRSGPDGFVWAPQTRAGSAAGQAPGETANTARTAQNAQPASPAGKSLSPGQDPGTPAVTEAHGPGVLDGSANARRP